ncbi:MAG TPA: NAD(+) synthase [Armatimonadota bacterium]|nr:NAD(+) synthase [Armatimonadota bacterium]
MDARANGLGQYGFVRIAAGSPRLFLADPRRNAEVILDLMRQAGESHCAALALPEMCLTGYTCSDLFLQRTLLEGALDALDLLLQAQKTGGAPASLITLVGMPLAVGSRLFNCAVAIQQGRVLGVIPKTYLPNYSEYYDKRFFAAARDHSGPPVAWLFGEEVPFTPDLLFTVPNQADFTLGIEICEDAWAPIPRCAVLAASGATLIFNLSASVDLIGKAEFRRDVLLRGHSALCLCGYVYAAAGPGESTTDTVYGGHCLIAENGGIIGESERFALDRSTLLIRDIDLQRLIVERQRMTSFSDCQPGRLVTTISAGPIEALRREDLPLRRPANPTPFVPAESEDRSHRCEEIFRIQTTALGRRSQQLGHPRFVVGISGGLDSTLAALVCHKTLRLLERDPADLVAVTMPGFGTSDRTRQNALALAEALTGQPPLEVDIRPACLQHLGDIQHPAHQALTAGTAPDPDTMNVTFENVQARERTQILMDLANNVGGMVIGTGDLSEMALGWSTYNGDHMSMYAVNCSIPKTLIQYIVGWAADVEFAGAVGQLLHDVLATPISPELLPTKEGKISQETESLIGPYVLHDFFLFHFVRAAASPEKIFLLARQAFASDYEPEEIKKWLTVFLKRFFHNQFKRSCIPDGPKVGTVSLSPRADWRMPSDANADAWLNALNAEDP